MKPEQVAHAAWNGFCKQVNLFEIEVAFERAVYDAVIAERERCAQIAETMPVFASPRDVAAVIRSTSP